MITPTVATNELLDEFDDSEEEIEEIIIEIEPQTAITQTDRESYIFDIQNVFGHYARPVNDHNKPDPIGIQTSPTGSISSSNSSPRRNKWHILVMVVGLITLALLLTSCSVPGANEDPPCVGANKGADGCADPTGKALKDQDNGGEWYDKWAFDIIRRFASSASINSVGVGISIFWKIFTTLGSTDFVDCKAGVTDSPQCTAVDLLGSIRLISFVFFPLILSYKFFKSYIVGSVIDTVYESAFSFVPKVLIAGVVIMFLEAIITGAFGMSNLLFSTILGGPKDLSNASGILGDSNCVNQSGGRPVNCTVSGIYTIQTVQDVGLTLIMMLVCFMVAIAYIALGICFFFRTIIILVMLCLGPLAIVAATTEETKPWFGKWLAGVQALLVAPIPVAICFALVKAFLGGDGIPPAHEEPAGFLLRLVYVLSFLVIGTLMMFRIAGQTGGALFGLAVGGAAALGGYAAGRLGGSLAGAGSGAGAGAGAGSFMGGASPQLALAGGGGFDGAGSNPYGSAPPTPGGGGNYNRAGGSAYSPNMGGGGGYYQQSQSELTSALRAMNANTSASMMASATNATASSYSTSGGGIGSRSSSGSGFSHTTHRNLQNMGHWAGRQVGIDAPQISFAPELSNGGSGGSNSIYGTPVSAPPQPQPQMFQPLTAGNGGGDESQGRGGVKPDAPSPDGPDSNDSPNYLWPDAEKQNYGDTGAGSTGSTGSIEVSASGAGTAAAAGPGGNSSPAPVYTPYTNFYDRLNNAPAPATPIEQMDFERDMGVGEAKYQGQGSPRYWQALDKSYEEYATLMGQYNPMAEDYANAQLLYNNSLRSEAGAAAGSTTFEGSQSHKDFLRMYAQRTGQPGTQENPRTIQSGANVLARPDNNKWKQPNAQPSELAKRVDAQKQGQRAGRARSNDPNPVGSPYGSRKPNVPSIRDLTQDPGQAKVQARWAKRTPGAI